LEHFWTAQKLNRQAQWPLNLSWFDFLLHHKPGKSMGKPDALSQHVDHGDGSRDNKDITLLQPELFAICALEGLIVEGEEQDILQDICHRNQAGAQEDAVATAAQALKKSAVGKSLQSAKWWLTLLEQTAIPCCLERLWL
jgi:hypothetical protein